MIHSVDSLELFEVFPSNECWSLASIRLLYYIKSFILQFVHCIYGYRNMSGTDPAFSAVCMLLLMSRGCSSFLIVELSGHWIFRTLPGGWSFSYLVQRSESIRGVY